MKNECLFDFKNTVLTYDIALIIAHKVSWLKLFKPHYHMLGY